MQLILQGSFGHFGAEQLLTLISTNHHSGILEVIGDRDTARVYFNDGAAVYATGPFGSTGATLIADLFAWDEGTFTFTDDSSLPSGVGAEPIDLESSFTEGKQRADEWRGLLRFYPNDRLKLRVVADPRTDGGINLTTDEFKLLMKIGQGMTLARLREDLQRPVLEIYRSLQRLEQAGLLERLPIEEEPDVFAAAPAADSAPAVEAAVSSAAQQGPAAEQASAPLKEAWSPAAPNPDERLDWNAPVHSGNGSDDDTVSGAAAQVWSSPPGAEQQAWNAPAPAIQSEVPPYFQPPVEQPISNPGFVGSPEPAQAFMPSPERQFDPGATMMLDGPSPEPLSAGAGAARSPWEIDQAPAGAPNGTLQMPLAELKTMSGVPAAGVLTSSSGATIQLTESAYTIGRSTGQDIPITDISVSSKHARISRTYEGFVVEDMDSRNGTFVNGERIHAPRVISDGDVLGFGKVVYTFTLAPRARGGPAPLGS